MNQPLSLPVFFENGKMDADFEVKEGYVIGLCVLYAQRAAKKQEYMIRDRSIVTIGNRALSECVQIWPRILPVTLLLPVSPYFRQFPLLRFKSL